MQFALVGRRAPCQPFGSVASAKGPLPCCQHLGLNLIQTQFSQCYGGSNRWSRRWDDSSPYRAVATDFQTENQSDGDRGVKNW
jgi:hypothetical protein